MSFRPLWSTQQVSEQPELRFRNLESGERDVREVRVSWGRRFIVWGSGIFICTPVSGIGRSASYGQFLFRWWFLSGYFPLILLELLLGRHCLLGFMSELFFSFCFLKNFSVFYLSIVFLIAVKILNCSNY